MSICVLTSLESNANELEENDNNKKRIEKKGAKPLVVPCSTDWNILANKSQVTVSTPDLSKGSTNGPEFVLDGNQGGNDFWFSNNQGVSGKTIIQFQFPSPTTITGIESAHNTFLSNGTQYRIDGSNDGTTWTAITGTQSYSTSTSASSVAPVNTHKFPFPGNTQSFSYYRIYGTGSGNTIWNWWSEIYFDGGSRSAGLTNLSYNYGANTAIGTDDFYEFTLNPSGTGNYNISSSVGTISPTSGSFNSATQFALSPGSVGQGDITLTLVDLTNSCDIVHVITDTGIKPFVDTDGDLVPNDEDEDDDNDGILDVVENSLPDYNLDIPTKQLIKISKTAGSAGSQGGNPGVFLDGNLTATNFYYTNSGITNLSLVILEFPKPVVLTGLEYFIGNSFMIDNGSVTKIQASNDGTTWVDIAGASFTKSGPNNTPGQLSSAPYAETFLWTNTTPYKYYRHHGVSGGANQNPWVYEIFFRFNPIIDTDGDGITNSEDLDSDGDGIPDNVEAQSTSGYIAPNADTPTQYSTNSGKNSAYLTGLTPPDLNNNVCPDYLDTDTDGDGTLDKDESGLTFNNAPGTNGLDSGSETVDDYSDVNGNINNPLADLSNIINAAEADYRVQPSPGGIFSTLSTWLKADNKVFNDLGATPAENGDFIQQWTTQIGTNNATQTNASRTPTYRGGNTPEGINFNPAVDFDVDKLDFPSTLGLEGSNPFTVIFLTKQTAYGRFLGPVSNSGGRFEIDVVPLSAARAGQTGYGPDPLSSNTGDNLPYISTVGKDPTGIYFQTNGQQSSVDAQNVSFAGGQNISLGTAYNINPYFNGSLSEFIVYDSKLDSVSLNKVYSYLAIKYGAELSPNQVQYSASDGTVIWNDVTYWHNVGVIGRDLASGLIQVQSASQQDSTLAIGLGVVDSLNSSNPNSFAANNTFLAWGSNDQAQNMSIPITGTDLRHSQRIYKVKEVNTVGNVEVRIHESVFSGGSPTLIRSTDDTFTTADEFISLSKSGSYYRFSIDFADGDYFTLAQSPQVLISTEQTTCTGPIANQDGKLILNSTAPVGVKVGYSKGFVYTGADFTNAVTIAALPMTLTDTLINPIDFEEPYTIRTYFSPTFFMDQVVSMKPKVCAIAELNVSITPISASANEGEFLTYEVSVANAGPDPAANLEIKVEIPSSVELLSTVPDVGAYDASTQIWSIETAPIGTYKMIVTYKMK